MTQVGRVWRVEENMELKGMQCHAELREVRLANALARHKATIIDSYFENYNKLVANLSEDYYKQDIDLDESILELNHREIQTQIQFYRKNYHRYKEIVLAFLSLKTLLHNLKHMATDL